MSSTYSQSESILQCPQCGGKDVSRSQRVSLLDQTLSVLNIYPYRCHNQDCGCRFRRTRRR